MTFYDDFGAAVSHNVQIDIDDFHKAAVLMLGYAPDPIGLIKQVLERSPEFIMARCFLAGSYLIASDKRRRKPLIAQYEILKTQIPLANERERGHIYAIKLWLEGDWYGASQAYADILLENPRDLVALQYGHQTDFLLGLASSARDRPERIMRFWSNADAEYSFILGMKAFGLEECGHYPQAEALAHECVSLNSKDTWGVHALAHCYEMQGKTDQGISFMEKCENEWGGDNYLSIHNRWHLSLYWIEQCNFAKALKIHDEFMIVDQKSELMDVHDSTALLWRLKLDGVDVGDRWGQVANRYTHFIDQAYMPFNDMHAMMSFVATERMHEAKELIKVLEASSTGRGISAMILNTVGLPVVNGLYAFGQGDYKRAKKLLSSIRHSSHLLGGSIAQRDIINLTLLEAARLDGDATMVKGLIAERTIMKPASPLTNFFENR